MQNAVDLKMAVYVSPDPAFMQQRAAILAEIYSYLLNRRRQRLAQQQGRPNNERSK
jgi:hypothetical protein